MARLNPTSLIGFAASVAITLGAVTVAHGSPFSTTYLGAGVQSPNFPTACTSGQSCFYGTETFSGWNGGTFNSTFKTGINNFDANNYINATYTANSDPNWSSSPANQYGGSGGVSNYPELFGNTGPGDAYAIKLTHSASIPGVNYFGLWITALDPSNDLQFYSNGTLLYSFNSTDLQSALGSCSTSNAYCGNPTTPFKGQNAGEQYAYVNFFDTVGYFDQVVLYNTSSSGFELSNHSVAFVNQIATTGTTFTAPDRPPSAAFTAKVATLIPEPASVMLVFTALVVLLFRYQRRRAAQAAAEPIAPDEKKHRRRRRRNRSRNRPAPMGWPAGSTSRFSA